MADQSGSSQQSLTYIAPDNAPAVFWVSDIHIVEFTWAHHVPDPDFIWVTHNKRWQSDRLHYLTGDGSLWVAKIHVSSKATGSGSGHDWWHADFEFEHINVATDANHRDKKMLIRDPDHNIWELRINDVNNWTGNDYRPTFNVKKVGSW